MATYQGSPGQQTALKAARLYRSGRRTSRTGPVISGLTRNVVFPNLPDVVTTPTKAIAGRILADTGNYLDGALVVLFLAATNQPVASTISDAEGYYRFPRNGYDTRSYYVAAWTRTGQAYQSVTRRILTPA